MDPLLADVLLQTARKLRLVASWVPAPWSLGIGRSRFRTSRRGTQFVSLHGSTFVAVAGVFFDSSRDESAVI